MNTIFPKVSIYIVNHNYGRYLRQAIESVLSQTFQDFELLIVDNGSSDNSRDIISKYNEHPKTTIILQDNIGLNKTNNVAIHNTKGSYIMRLDADDYLDAHALEVMVNTLDRREEVGLVFPDYYLVEENGEVIEQVKRHNFDEVSLFDQPAHGACTMVRRSHLRALGGYDESYHCQDGWDLWVRFIKQYGVANISLPLFYYRQHAKSLTKNENRILLTRSKIFKNNAPDLSKKKTIALIPVLDNSAHSHSIALEPLGETPLIDWTILKALAARHISKVCVISSNKLIQKHVESTYGKQVSHHYMQWKSNTPDEKLDIALSDFFELLPSSERDFDTICLLDKNTPFKTANDIDTAVDALHLFECNRVISVRRNDGQLYQHNGEGILPLKKEKNISFEKEDIYQRTGTVMIIRRGHLYRDTEKDKRIGHIEVSEESSFKISSEWSWNVAKWHARHISELKQTNKN